MYLKRHVTFNAFISLERFASNSFILPTLLFPKNVATNMNASHASFSLACICKVKLTISKKFKIWGSVKTPSFILASLNVGNYEVRHLPVLFMILTKFFMSNSFISKVGKILLDSTSVGMLNFLLPWLQRWMEGPIFRDVEGISCTTIPFT